MNVNNIIQIYHKDSGVLLKYNNIEFIENNLYIDNKRVCRNNKYSVEYHCFTCNRQNNVILNTFISKVNRGIKNCNMCSGFYECNIKMEEQYCRNYFLKYPTEKEMELQWNKILSIQKEKFNGRSMDEFKYYPAIKIKNSNSFQPFFKDLKRDIFERPINLKFKCDNCGCNFYVKDLTRIKNKLKILCNKCTNLGKIKSTKIFKMKNCMGENIIYFNNFQKRVIKYFNKNGILIRKRGKYYEVPEWNKIFCLIDGVTIDDIDNGVLIMNPRNFHKIIKDMFR